MSTACSSRWSRRAEFGIKRSASRRFARNTKDLSHPRTGERALVFCRKAHGSFLASSFFVTFRAIFVSRDFGITRRVGTWRRRRVKRSFEPGDGSALPIAEGDLPRSRVFVVRAKRREAPQPPRPPPAQSPHRKNPSHARARLARARPRSESITSITIPIPHQIAHARARVLVVVHDLSPGYARVSGDADVVSAKGLRCRACGA